MRPDGSRRNAGGTTFTDDSSPQLEDLFSQARAHRPEPEQLSRMLRAVARKPWHRAGPSWKAAGLLAACAAAVTAGVFILLPPNQSEALGFSQILEAMQNVTMLKTTREDGGICWVQPGVFSAYSSKDGSKASYFDFTANRVSDYTRTRNCILISTLESETYNKYHSFGDALNLTDLRRLSKLRGRSFEERWDQRETTLGERRVIELTTKDDRYQYYRRFVVAADTGRILEADTRDGHVSYAYPESGPRDIYDLGVPKDTRVVDGGAPPELWELRAKVLAESKTGFGAYRMVRSDTESLVHRVISDGRRLRVEAYWGKHRRHHVPSDLDALLADARWYLHATPPIDDRYFIAISDGDITQVVHFRTPEGTPEFRIIEQRATGQFADYFALEYATWEVQDSFFPLPWNRQDVYLGTDEQGQFGYRSLYQAIGSSRPWHDDRWYDPNRGYAVARVQSFWLPDADWQLDPTWKTPDGRPQDPEELRALARFEDVIEWAELRPGQSYPAMTRVRIMRRDEHGAWVQSTPQLIAPNTYAGQGLFHRCIVAEPLDEVDEAWFTVPREWRDLPTNEL
jgi:hypothetical protein